MNCGRLQNGLVRCLEVYKGKLVTLSVCRLCKLPIERGILPEHLRAAIRGIGHNLDADKPTSSEKIKANNVSSNDDFKSGVHASTLPNPAPNASPTGLGDLVASFTKAIGIKPCGGCKKRQAALNRLVPFQHPKP
jgi:hypothetical protein